MAFASNGALIERIHIPGLHNECEYCEVDMSMLMPDSLCCQRVEELDVEERQSLFDKIDDLENDLDWFDCEECHDKNAEIEDLGYEIDDLTEANESLKREVEKLQKGK